MASVVLARRQVWLSEANVSDQDCATVVAAPVVPGEVFGPSSGAALEQARKARELTYAVRQMGQMGLFLATGGWGRSTSSVQDWGGSQRTLTQSSLANRRRDNHHSFCQQQPTKQLEMQLLGSLGTQYPKMEPSHQITRVLFQQSKMEMRSTEISTPKRAITLLPSESVGQGFYSAYFLISKKDEDWRSIFNLKRFNWSLKRLPFRLLNLSTLFTSIRQGGLVHYSGIL